MDEYIIIYAIPFFLLSVALEVFALRHAAHEHDDDPSTPIGYVAKDSSTSMTLGAGHLVVGFAWKLVLLVVYAGLYTISPFQLSASDWWVWVLLFFADDLAFYAYHRSHHRIRIFWATHVVHHSSETFNFSTALRQDWSPFTGSMFWLPLALFFPTWMIFVAMSWSLIYQFTLHTEVIDKYPKPIEWFWNTPSHHRVHHGSQEQYLDKNYGGILIIWDRMFGSFEPEDERVRYGLTKNINTFNPVKVAFGEFHNIARDVRGADRMRDRLGYIFGGPGWKPSGTETEGVGLADASRDRAEVPSDRATVPAGRHQVQVD